MTGNFLDKINRIYGMGRCNTWCVMRNVGE